MNQIEKQIYQSGGVIEDIKEEINSMGNYRPEIRPSYSFPEVACLDIVKKHGRDMHPSRFPKMSDAEKEKFRRIVRYEYPHCIVGGYSKRFF
jgi:hypothetical protein